MWTKYGFEKGFCLRGIVNQEQTGSGASFRTGPSLRILLPSLQGPFCTPLDGS